MKEFEHALKHLSKTHLQRVAVQYKKRTTACENKADYVHLLATTMTKAQKVELLTTQLLAGRTSMALVKFEKDPLEDHEITANFQIADVTPRVVHVGKPDELIEGQSHILWAMLDGSANYIDPYLEVKVEPRAILVDTFYDHAARILQLRANYSISKRVTREFAKLQNMDTEDGLYQRLYLKTRDELNEFADLLHARVTKCKGQQHSPKGFIYVTGETDAADEIDARATEDYKRHVATTDPISEVLRFHFAGDDVKIGVGFDTQSIVFQNNVTETVMQHVYSSLKEYLLDG